MFAAYAERQDVESGQTSSDRNKDVWQSNTSFSTVFTSRQAVDKVDSTSEESKALVRIPSPHIKEEQSDDDDKCSSAKLHKAKKHSKKKKHKKDSPIRSDSVSELPHIISSQKYYLDVKAEKSNLFSCPYSNTLKRYYPIKGVLGAHLGKFKSSKKDSVKKRRYYGKIGRKLISAAPEGTEDSVLNKGSEESQMLNERLKTNPDDIQAWLKFIDLQTIKASDIVDSEEGTKPTKKRNFKALIERKLSIIAKAMEHNPKSVELILYKLKLLDELGSSPTLHQEWQNALFTHPTSLKLWNEYLTFTECCFEEFTVKRVLKAYSSCLTKLYQIQLPTFISHAKPKHVEHCMIDIVSKLARFLHSTGWTELCISLFQAFAEICLSRSGDVSPNALETWWNSNSARFGEKLISQEVSQRKVHGLDLGDNEDAVLSEKGSNVPSSWLAIEQLRSLEHWQACSSEDECEDVERYVKFSDVLPYLFPIANSEHLHYRLLVGLLQSIGIPLAPASQAQAFWAPVVIEENFFNCFDMDISSALPPSYIPTLTNSSSYIAFIREIFTQLWSKLKNPYRLESILWWFAVEKQLVAIKKSEKKDFSLHWKETKAWIRSFLKKVPPNELASSVLLYTAYASIQVEAGECKDARRVLQTILEHNNTNPFQVESGKGHFSLRSSLLHCWFEFIRTVVLEVSEKSHKVAVSLLVKLALGYAFNAEVKEVTSALILKAKRKFEALLDDSQATSSATHILFHEPDEMTTILGCFSILLSLIEGSTSAFSYVTQWLGSNRRTFELSFDNRYDAAALRYHSLREHVYASLLHLLSSSRSWVRDYNPKHFHDVVSSALEEYPNSWQLLTIVIRSDMIRCNTFGNFWRNLVSRAKSVKTEMEVPTSIAVLVILARWEKSLAQSDAINDNEMSAMAQSFGRRREHLAEYCIENTLVCHVPFVWRLLVHQLFKNGDTRRCQGFLYRAFKDCPWSKELYMDMVRCSPASLEETASLLSEKELRLRLPVEELRLLLQSETEEMDS